jgi:hypothetical protein
LRLRNIPCPTLPKVVVTVVSIQIGENIIFVLGGTPADLKPPERVSSQKINLSQPLSNKGTLPLYMLKFSITGGFPCSPIPIEESKDK